ncbi:MAG TPA: hypothetical protein VFB45_15845 [Pseudolabrys sp.]|nr:hypothetical protein [Pseudolabrys sp.]
MAEIFGQLYADETWLQVVLITVVLGGGAAWQTGRAIAGTWRPLWHAIIYTLLLGAAVRFVHFALFEGELLSPLSYLVDTAYLLAVGCVSWQERRTSLMVTQYPWLYERSGPLSWRDRPAS